MTYCLASTNLNITVELDDRFDVIFQTIPPGWEYQTVYTKLDTDIFYHGCYHIYDDYWIANMWNAMRSIRILLHENIRKVLMAGFVARPPVFDKPEHTLQFHDSTCILYQLQGDILASVPQHLGFISQPGSRDSNPFSNVQDASPMPWSHFKERSVEQFPTVRAAGPTFLLWSLWLAGGMDIASQQAQDFVVKKLKFICQSMGFQQALVLARAIETKSQLNFAMPDSSHSSDFD